MQQPEILAPAGSYEGLIAAIHAGADAVYIGGSKFGARAYAGNLSEEDMLKAIDYVHLHKRKIYLTVNTLLKNEELEQELYQYLLKYYLAGLDAVIVQDVGVLHFIHRNLKELPIHASTQMTLTMAESAGLLSDMGVTRIVTSRELSLSEIKNMREHTNLEIESFVHGALCYCYSGQCMMSSILGGRSGNRGRCAQPCRMPYSFSEHGRVVSNSEEKYLLSPKDICTLSLIPELIESGIDSFKIEGRMKRAEYAALIVSKYRKYVDLYCSLGREGYHNYLSSHQEEYDKDIQEMMDLYNRGSFTTGYYVSHNGKDMMSPNRPNHNGVLVGEVTGVKGISAQIRLSENIKSQDVLEIRNKAEGIYEFTVKNPADKNTVISANFLAKSGVQKGQQVYRTKNQKLLTRLREHYIENSLKEEIKGTLTARVGEPIKLHLKFDETETIVQGSVVEASLNQPTSIEKIKTQLSKTNATEFVFKELKIESEDNIFIPASTLNELRRNGIAELESEIQKRYQRKLPEKIQPDCAEGKKDKTEKNTGISVYLTDTRLLSVILSFEQVADIYLDTADILLEELKEISDRVKNSGKRFYLAMPHIFRQRTREQFLNKKKYLTGFMAENISGFLVRNLEELDFLLNELKYDGSQIILDYNVYTSNKESKLFYNEKGILHFTASEELTDTELNSVGCEDSDLIVYGYLPLMVSAQCVLKNTKGCLKERKGLQKQEKWNILTDRCQKNFYVKNCCRDCYNLIYNGQPVSLLKYKKEISALHPANVRLDFTIESEAETKEILREFINVFCMGKEPSYEIKNYTRGHFKRGIE